MERLWFVSIDTVRLRRALHGATARAVQGSIAPAAASAGVCVVDACVTPSGLRAVVEASSAGRLRIFVRRFMAWSGRPEFAWRPRYRTASLRRSAIPEARAQLRRMRDATREVPMIATSSKARATGTARKLATLVRHVDRSIDRAIGSDEAAARVRRYVGEHDAPPDDRVAFARLCIVVFAQGLGYDVVLKKAAELRSAFDDFDPSLVSGYDDEHARMLLEAPIVKNAAKIRACIENAKRWCALATQHGSYLGRVASIAAADDPVAGWHALADVVRGDFVHVGESAARQTLKRWGFFTAFANPGARRSIERLGMIDAEADGAAVQRLIGGAAHRLGRDPYAVEAAFALFAGLGPCQKKPKCDECGLADRCPSAVV